MAPAERLSDDHLEIEVTAHTPAGISREFDLWQKELDVDVIATSIRYQGRPSEHKDTETVTTLTVTAVVLESVGLPQRVGTETTLVGVVSVDGQRAC